MVSFQISIDACLLTYTVYVIRTVLKLTLSCFFFPFHGVENHIREISLLMHTVYLIRSLLKFKLSRFISLLYISPLPCLGSVVVGIVYKDLHDLLAPYQPIRIKAGNRR